MHYVCAWHLWRTEEVIRCPGIRVKYSYALPCWCWELNSGLMLEQYSFLTTKQYIQTVMLRLLKFYFKSICTVVLFWIFPDTPSLGTLGVRYFSIQHSVFKVLNLAPRVNFVFFPLDDFSLAITTVLTSHLVVLWIFFFFANSHLVIYNKEAKAKASESGKNASCWCTNLEKMCSL